MPSRAVPVEELLEAVPVALVGVDRWGVIRDVNRQAGLLFGYDPKDLVGQPVETLVPESARSGHPALRNGYVAARGTHHPGLAPERPPWLESGPPPRCKRGRRRDGTEFPLDLGLSRLAIEGGQLFLVAMRDLTDRDMARGKDDRVSRLAAMVEHSDDAIIGTTLDGIVTTWNPAATRLFGYSSEEIIGRSGSVLVPEDRSVEMSAVFARIRAGEHVGHLETVGVRKDGRELSVSLSVAPVLDADGAVVGGSVIGRDVTDQRAAFEAARSMIESSLDSLVSISPAGRITDANEATVTLTGVAREALIGTSFSQYFTDSKKAERIYQLVFSEGAAVDYPLTIRHRDGTLTEVGYNAAVQRDSGGKVLGVFAAARDMTRLLQAFKAARSMIEASLDSMVAISPEGRITDANEATVKLTGVPREALIGTAFSDYFTEPEKANVIYQLVLAHDMAVDYPLTMRHRDGTPTDVLYNASVYRDDDGAVLGVFAAARDVTKQVQAQRVAAQEQARAVERLVELERFQRLTVGRELKMIELKKEIESLRALIRAQDEDEGEDEGHAPAGAG